MVSDIVAVADVAEGALAEPVTVDPDFAIGHDAIEPDVYPAIPLVGRQRKMLAIPADAGRQKSAGAAGWRFLIEGSLDTPIVRDFKGAPFRVIEFERLSAFNIVFEEAPIVVEFFDDARSTLTLGGGARRDRQQ